ncbi:MAG TPA: hypothetical protein VNJ05_00545 [Sphingomicrobium sp.]|nr:hypothetical protein [Sphingomicrobium sp.]
MARWKRQTPASAFRHALRVLTIIAKASFWIACYHYFGTKALLMVAAGWTFILGVKDLTFARVRLSMLKDPERRARVLKKSVAAELFLMAFRLGVFFGVAAILVPINRDVAATVSIMAICAGLWTRETFVGLSTAYRMAKWRTVVSFIASTGAIASIVYFAENNLDPVRSAVWALLIREAVTFFGYASVALLGSLGLRPAPGAEDLESDEDEDGGESAPVFGPDGREIRSVWKVLIADNVIYSRWRMMNFATRFVAHGVLGPLGGIATRIAFSYGKPGPYQHHASRISTARIVGLAIAATATVSGVIYFAQQAGLLRALGIVVGAFLFRLAAMSVNLLLWRQLSPIVGKQKKSRIAAKDDR